jgi:hypothetical protein
MNIGISQEIIHEQGGLLSRWDADIHRHDCEISPILALVSYLLFLSSTAISSTHTLFRHHPYRHVHLPCGLPGRTF